MVEFPDLPEFDLLEFKNKRPPNDVIYKWMDENLRQMKESGQIERIRKEESRRLVGDPFVLYD